MPTIADEMAARLIENRPAERGGRVSVLVNSVGATPLEELFIVIPSGGAAAWRKGLIIFRRWVTS